MKILFVNDHIFQTKDGLAYSDKFPYHILKRYIDVFSHITFVARSNENKDIEKIPLASGEGVDFIFLENISSVKSHFGLRQRNEKIIENLIKEHDGVIIRLPSEYGLLTAEIANRLNSKWAIEVVGCAWDSLWNYGGLKPKLYAPIIFTKMKNVVKKSDNVLYVTKQFLQNKYPVSVKSKTTNVSNVELPDIDNNILASRFRRIEDNKKLVFGTIGSLKTRYKGVHIAIEALSMICNSFDNFEYHVLGAGDSNEYKLLAEKLGIGDKVCFDGILPSGDPILEWLDNIDIYLQPSLTEGLPRALLEAMSRGCSAVGSTAGGIPELLVDQMLFDPKKPNDFSKIILKLVNSKELMKEESTRNFETAKQYQKSLLDKRRQDFWSNFRGDISKTPLSKENNAK